MSKFIWASWGLAMFLSFLVEFCFEYYFYIDGIGIIIAIFLMPLVLIDFLNYIAIENETAKRLMDEAELNGDSKAFEKAYKKYTNFPWSQK